MKLKIFMAVLILTLIIFPAHAHEIISGDVIVVFKPRDKEKKISASDFGMGSEAFRVASIATESGAWVKNTYPNISQVDNNVFALLHSDTMSSEELIKELSKRSDVVAVSPNYKVYAAVIPNDTYTPSNNDGLWGLNYINAPEAWEITKGNENIYIAVLDSGIDYENPDISANYDRTYSKNFLSGSDTVKDENGHGTHVSGTIGAVGNNSLGICGVNWNVKLIGLRALNSGGSGNVSDVIKAVDYLTGKGYPKVYFGGMILKALEKSGLEINEQNEKNFREQIRKTEGKDWVVRQVIDEVHDLMKAGQKRIVLDGVYSWTEYSILKKEFPKMLTFVAIVVPKKLRYKRVGQRQVRPLTPEEVRSRDIGEIENMEKGGPIAAADYYILNDGTVEQMQEKMGEILKEINF